MDLPATRAAVRTAAPRLVSRLHTVLPLAAAMAALLLSLPGDAFAQVSALGDAPVAIHAQKTGRVRITALSGDAQVAIVADGAITAYAQPVRFVIAWDFPPNSTSNLHLVGYFLEADAALRDGSAAIPSSYVEGRVGTAAPWGAFSATYGYPTSPPTAANALHLWTSPGTSTSGRRGEVTLDLYLRLNLTGREVPAGDYAGTLVLQAFTQ